MPRFTIYATLVVASLIGLIFFQNQLAVALLTGTLTAFLLPIVDAGVSNFRYTRLMLSSVRHYRKRVRVSISYLFRIELNGKYLLIRGSRYPDHFQPVGGVYKFNPSAKDVFRQWSVESDDLIPIDNVSEDDLRVRVPGKHLLSFVHWFEAAKNREVGPHREFHEELVRPGYLPSDTFAYVRSDFVERQIKPVRYSEYAQSFELLIADIYDVTLNQDQRAKLQDLQASHTASNEIIWANSEHIRRRGAVPGLPQNYRISTTASWTL